MLVHRRPLQAFLRQVSPRARLSHAHLRLHRCVVRWLHADTAATATLISTFCHVLQPPQPIDGAAGAQE